MQSININNKYGNKLAAYLFIPDTELCLFLVVCHGFRGAKENGGRIFDFASQVNKLGVGVLAFDFSGSGQSEGNFTTMILSRQASDLHYVIDYLYSQYNLPLVLLGRSFGGSTVIAGGARDERVKGYILWSTPIFLAKTFATMIPEEHNCLEEGLVVHIQDDAGEYDLSSEFIRDFARHNMDDYLQAINAKPVLIIHAQDDELVPADNAVYMDNKLEKSSLFLVEQAGHRFLHKTEQREKLTVAWLEKIVEEI